MAHRRSNQLPSSPNKNVSAKCGVKVTPKRFDLPRNQHMLSNQVARLENSWKKLTAMYKSLQGDYNTMRANHTTMAVIVKRFSDDIKAHESKIAGLTYAKVSLEEKISDLEKKLKNTTNELEETKDEKVDLVAYNLAKDARIRVIKDAIDKVKVSLGSWGYNLNDDEIENLFKDLDQLV